MSMSSLLQVVERKQTGVQEEDLCLLRFLPASNHCVRNMCECVCQSFQPPPASVTCGFLSIVWRWALAGRLGAGRRVGGQ